MRTSIRQRFLSILLVGMMFFSLLPSQSVLADDATAYGVTFAGGSGTVDDPYLIDTAQQFADFASGGTDAASLWKCHFKLTDDIDLADFSLSPIGVSSTYSISTYFMGGLDGDHHTISHLTLNNTGYATGLFMGLKSANSAQKAYVKNLTLDAANVTGVKQVGALVGYNCGGVLENCQVTNSTVSGWNTVGGLVGKNYYAGPYGSYFMGTLTTCSFEGKVQKTASGSGSSQDFGGLVGYDNGTSDDNQTLSQCYANAQVTGSTYVGGLVGEAYVTTIKDCYAKGSVVADNTAGGLVGRMRGGYSGHSSLQNGYAVVAVSASKEAGGLIGSIDESSTTVKNLTYNKELDGAPEIAIGTNNTIDTVTGQTANEVKALANTLNGDRDPVVWRQANGAENDGYPCLAAFATDTPPAKTPLEAPTNLSWDKNTMKWDSVENADSYLIQLYKDGEKSGKAFSCTDTFCDVTARLLAADSGTFTFTVTACGSGDYEDSAPSAQSEAYVYTAPIKLEAPSHLSWQKNTATWQKVDNADSYLVYLYKDDTQQGDAIFCLETSYDFTDAMVESADYTFAVIACGSGDYQNSALSEKSAKNRFIADEDFVAISSANDLIELANITGENAQKEAYKKNYRLTQDIVLTAKTTNKIMKSIGNATVPFTGVFDGNGKRIQNLGLEATDGGLFYKIGEDGIVKDLTIESAIIACNGSCGILAKSNNGTIINCAVIDSKLSSKNGANLGGLVYENNETGRIERSFVSGGDVSTDYNPSYATGMGGFVANNRGDISECYTTMEVKGANARWSGGFAGQAVSGTISDCYAMGDVAGREQSGGFVGRFSDRATLKNCYSHNNVSTGETGENVNYFIGALQYGGGTLTNCYYVNENSFPDGASEIMGETGVTADGLKSVSLGSNWQVDSEGKINAGLPYLKHLAAPTTVVKLKTVTIDVTIANFDETTYRFSPRTVKKALKVTAKNPTVYDALEAYKDTIPFHATYSKEFGYFVDTIDGVTLSEPNGWMFTINDVLSPLGVSSQSIKTGDKILWYPGTPANLFTGPKWDSMQTGYEPPTGDGTPEHPYEISTATQLAHITDHLDASYRLVNDIDLSDIDWEPIGSVDTPFTGQLDGNGHTISHLTVSKGAESQNVGLFGVIFGAKLTNLTLTDVKVTGGTQVGALVGYSKEATDINGVNTAGMIGNCHVKGGVVTALSQINTSAITRVGGLVGFNDGNNLRPDTKESSYHYCSIDKSSANVSVKGTDINAGDVGGLVGCNHGMITNCYAAGNVEGGNLVGGLVGLNTESIFESYATGHVTGHITVGGFVGSSQGRIVDCFSTGNVIANKPGGQYYGGFAGSIIGYKTKHCLSTGTLLCGSAYNGAFVGTFDGNLSTAGGALTANLIDCYGNNESAGGTQIKGIGNYQSHGSADSDQAAAAIAIDAKLAQNKLEELKESLSLDNIVQNDGTAGYLLAKDEAQKYHSVVTIPTSVEADSDITDLVVSLRDGQTADSSVLLAKAQKTYQGYTAYQASTGHIFLYKNSETPITDTITLLLVADGQIYAKDITVIVGQNTPISDDESTDTKSDWPLFRGDASNMGITGAATPRSGAETTLLWQKKLTTDTWGTASSPIIANGYLYVLAPNGLQKVDLTTGLILKTAPLADGIDYTPHIAYGDGKVFVPLKNGVVQAFDASSMDSLWVSSATASGDQLTGPLYYDNGYLYAGTYNYSSTGTYFCLNTNDPNPATGQEENKPVWTYREEGNGYYWAGAVVNGNAVMFGSEKGTLVSLNKTTGEVIDTYGAKDSIRSSVALAYGRVFFTSKDANIYSIGVDNEGHFNSEQTKVSLIAPDATASTSTPIVYSGRVYVGAKTEEGGLVGVLTSDTLTPIYAAKTDAYVQSSPLITTAYQNDTQKVYLYITGNKTPGGVQVMEDFSQNESPIISDLFTPDTDAQNYCTASVIADHEGNLYYKNDSGYFFRLGTKEASGAKVSFSTVPAKAEVSLKNQQGETIDPVSAHNYDLTEGTYTATISLDGYVTKTKTFTVTAQNASEHENLIYSISLSRNYNGGGETQKTLAVKFMLLGDSDHGTASSHTQNQTWIDGATITVPKGSTAYDVFEKALTGKGFTFVEKTYNYISSITTPSSLGNITLAEGTNGPNSGWMYNVNGNYPSYGMREQSLSDGDKIVFYYTDDYTKEPPSVEWNRDHASTGTTTNSPAPGQSVPTLTVTKGGRVTPSDISTKAGETVTFTIAPDSGYEIADVVVDGKSVGAVTSYTYSHLKASSLIEISFRKIGSTTPEPPANRRFTDVSDSHWAKTAIETLADKKVIFGKTETTFAPNDAITRAEFVSILARMSGDDLSATQTSFTDVPSDSWYASSVAWAVKAGVVSGITETTFAPNQLITREQMAAILVRYAQYKGINLSETKPARTFTDQESISSYAADAVSIMQNSGIISGTETGAFAPQNSATRAEAAQMLYLLLTKTSA